MPISVSIETQGIDEAIRKLRKISSPAVARGTMRALVMDIQGWISQYPPRSEANQPRPFVSGGKNYWYVRGKGMAWARKDGTTGQAYTSERLGPSWTTKVAVDGSWGRVGTRVSYAPPVQGPEQAGFHKERGWRTVVQAAKLYGPKAIKSLRNAIARIWKGKGVI